MDNDAISKSAALKMMDKYIDMAGNDDQMHHAMCVVAEGIKELPALDVVPVVYCKDCSYARPLNLMELMTFERGCLVCTSQHGAGTTYPERGMSGKVVFPKSFCSYGHRRTNGR